MAKKSNDGITILSIQIHSGLVEAMEYGDRDAVHAILWDATELVAEIKQVSVRAEFVRALAYTIRIAAGRGVSTIDNPEKELFTTGEAAQICKVSQKTIARYFDSGRLRGYRAPGIGSRLIFRDSLICFIRKCRITSKGCAWETLRQSVEKSGIPEWQEAIKNPTLDLERVNHARHMLEEWRFRGYE